ncbi:MAG: sulfite exporter TauE/SafE family protein [Pseudomonadota bacterium]
MTGTLLPESVSLLAASVLVTASFFTAALTAAAGIGGGLLMLALMTYLIPVSVLIPVHGLVQLGANSSRTFVQRADVDWRITRIFLCGSLFGAIAGAMIAVQLPTQLLQAILGSFILILVWLNLPKVLSPSKLTIGLGGLVTTFVSMFVGATGPLVAVFLNNLFENHRQMVATHGSTMVAQHGVKIVAFGLAGFAFADWLALVAGMVAAGFLGSKAGTMLMYSLPEKKLQLIFKVVLTLAALDLLRRSVMA